MLQFIAQTNNRYTLAETVQMAIEGGARWIQLHLPDMEDEEIKALSPDIIAMCKDAQAFLMLEDRVELAKELGLHGVHLTGASERSAASVREQLGPEAVVGTSVGSVAAVAALRNADIDYFTLSTSMDLKDMAAFVSQVRAQEIETPIVAAGEIELPQVASYLSAGVSGIATGTAIISAPDPVKETELFLSALNRKDPPAL